MRRSILVIMFAAVSCVACSDAERTRGTMTGTDRMRVRLAELRDTLGINENPYGNGARIAALLEYGRPAGSNEAFAYLMTLGRELVYAGRHREAIETLSEVRRQPQFGSQSPQVRREVSEHVAVSELRLLLEDPCVQAGPGAGCVPACRSVGPTLAADAAVQEYSLLMLDPMPTLTTRWLATLTSALGQTDRPETPLAADAPSLESGAQGELSTFTNLADCLGLDVEGHAGGVVLDDLDGDGDLDLMVSSKDFSDPLRMFRNLGDGTFREDTEAAGIGGLVGGLNLVHADYDNDGDIDVFVLRGGWFPFGHPNSLLQNQGDGSFLDVTDEAGVLSSHPTQTAAWGDFDNDGLLDLFVGNETRIGGDRHPSELFRNNGDGTFSDVASEVGLGITSFTKSAVWGDYDNDGRVDLFVSNFEEQNRLFHNDGPQADGGWQFHETTAEAGLGEPISSFPGWFWDYNNDGFLDLFVFGYRLSPDDVVSDALGLPHEGSTPRLYANNGDGTFTDRTEEVGLDRVIYAMGSNFGDLDNDGWLDVFGATGEPDPRAIYPNRAFRSVGGESFEEVTRAGGFGHLGKGHGIAFGDIDGDGDQDVYAVIGGAFEGDLGRNALYENPGNDNAWITLRLEGAASNRSAIGARVCIEVDTPDGMREIHVVVGSGGSFGASSLQQEIGLGNATAVTSIEILWPGSGHVDTYRDLPIREVLQIREGAASPTVVPPSTFVLSRTPRDRTHGP